MTVMEFFGCGFIAFGPPMALFIFTIATDPVRVIVLIASGFFWLLSLLLSSLLWFAVVPLRDQLAFGLVFSVLFQEVFRLLYYLLLKKASQGLQKVTQHEGDAGMQMANNPHLMAYVAGLGFGLLSGAFSLVNVLADSTGPGTIGINGDSDLFFITSALLTLCFILLHTFWGIIFYAGMDQRKYGYVAGVVVSHMLVSCLTLLHQTKVPVYAATLVPLYLVMAMTATFTYWQTLLNQGLTPMYLATLLPAYAVMVGSAWVAYFLAGGSLRNLKSCCRLRHQSTYNLD